MTRYKDRITSYCQGHGIEIPIGFYRHAASRYAAIDLEAIPPKLVAKTWLHHADVVYYLVHLAAGQKVRLLDFKEQCELIFNGQGTLDRGAPIACTGSANPVARKGHSPLQ